MLPDLESLRCFEAAAAHPSFRVAAASVALSAAAFGERIKRLEELVGSALFTRTTRHVALTAAGIRLLPQARRVLEEARRCLDVVAGEGIPAPFELTVGTRAELGLSWLVPALGALEQRRPERTLHLQVADSPVLIQHVAHGVLDAAVTSARLAHPRLEIEPLHPETYVFVGAASLLRRKPLRGPDDAGVHTLIEVSPDLPLFRYFQDAHPAGGRWRFARVLCLGTISALRQQVAAGRGVAVLPRYFVESDLRRGRFAALMPRVRMATDRFRLVWRTGHPRDAELRALAADLRQMPLR